MGIVYRQRQLSAGYPYRKTFPLLRPEYQNGAVTKDNKKNVWVHNYTGHLWYVNVTTGNIKPFQFLSSEHIGYIDVERIVSYTIHGISSGLQLTERTLRIRAGYGRPAAFHL